MNLQYDIQTVKLGTANVAPTLVWIFPIESAKKIERHLKNVSKGSYDYICYVRPIRRAIRAKDSKIEIYTSGFGNSHLSRIVEEIIEKENELGKFIPVPDNQRGKGW